MFPPPRLLEFSLGYVQLWSGASLALCENDDLETRALEEEQKICFEVWGNSIEFIFTLRASTLFSTNDEPARLADDPLLNE